ncbi:BglG family transcription antiterminator [Vagococcus sp. BWB3-3]|uniref:BglG family transcription antiterminator n=1 Tax=Vagococcus allomyrinae TaxID=2794353 RepID=A0A940SRJ4_9ENTE|nr:BglG family transcription antiterminator [Vagococcus allomyrinae]MBP1040887.1 BglG family transcription antiterminator [Vagococcus allomyrinae]
MNRRINKIILDVLRGEKKSLQDYAQLFKVSEQTIRNDLNDINEQFAADEQGQIIFDESGTIIFTSNVDWNQTLKNYATFQHYRLSQNERRTILALLLLNSIEYVTTYYLSEYLLVSRNTLISDIEELKLWFKKNELELYSQVGKGYQIRGDEGDLRRAMLKLILLNGLFAGEYAYAFGNENSIFQRLLLDIIDQDGIYQKMKGLLIKAERQHDLQLSDFSYQEVVCYLMIVVSRLEQGQSISEVKTEQLVSSSKYGFAKSLATEIESDFNVSFSESELLFLTGNLRQKSYLKNNGRKIDSIEIQILVNEFIFHLSNKLNIKYYLNSDLFELLENHLKLSVLRIKENVTVENDLLPEIMASYRDIFPIVRSSLTNLETYLEKSFSDDEVSFLVMYVMAIVENSSGDQPVITVRLVCNSGRGTAQLLKAKITRIFPQIEIISVDSSHDIATSQWLTQDLVVSTVPIRQFSHPLVIVNPMLSETNIMDIQRMVYQLQAQKVMKNQVGETVKSRKDEFYQKYLQVIDKYIDTEDKVHALAELERVYYAHFEVEKEHSAREIATLSDILAVQRIELNGQAETWQDAVRLSGQLLLRDRLITESYIESMIEIIDQLDSYVVIYPGVAIPHADGKNGALKTGASFVRLQQPVNFNHQKNDPVKYVIAFSIAEQDNLGSCLYNLTEILGSGKFDQVLGSCQTEWALLDKIKNLENEVMGIVDEKVTV